MKRIAVFLVALGMPLSAAAQCAPDAEVFFEDPARPHVGHLPKSVRSYAFAVASMREKVDSRTVTIPAVLQGGPRRGALPPSRRSPPRRRSRRPRTGWGAFAST